MHFPGAGNNVLSYVCVRGLPHTPHNEKSAEHSSEGGSEGIKKAFAAVGLAGIV